MMHHSNIIGLELVTVFSYAIIGAGFGLRSFLEGRQAPLLWPIMLMTIFMLCGITRMSGFITPLPLAINEFLHLTLAVIANIYGVCQLIYVCWPGLFTADEDSPRLLPPSEFE